MPTVLDDARDVAARLAQRPVLVRNAHVLWVLYQAVAADSDDEHALSHLDDSFQPIVRAITAFWACRRFSASS